MDPAVALVLSYSHVNGYFTVAEHPALGCSPDRADMIVGEVKHGAPHPNPAVRDPDVLGGALTRFGRRPRDRARVLSRELIRHGQVTALTGHAIRMAAFGNPLVEGRWCASRRVPMAHVVHYLQEYLREHWSALRHALLDDSPVAVLALIEKWGLARPRHDGWG